RWFRSSESCSSATFTPSRNRRSTGRAEPSHGENGEVFRTPPPAVRLLCPSTNQPMAAIRFGTSGWRGLIARDFTFDNVRLATQGIADFLNSVIRSPKSDLFKRKPVVILGHDTRFLGREFSLAAAEVLAANGLIPLLCNRDAPTPVIAHTIRERH